MWHILQLSLIIWWLTTGLFPKFGIIGTHPSPIPINKGSHPLHWMIALKIKRSKISFFLMDQGVDTGNVLYQKSFNLGNNISPDSPRRQASMQSSPDSSGDKK